VQAQHGGFEGFASAADPNATLLEGQIVNWRLRLQPGESDCSLEAQTAALRFRLQLGGAGCRLEVRIAAWGQRGGPLEPEGAIWNSTCCHLQLQVTIWSFRMPFEAPGVHLDRLPTYISLMQFYA